MASSLLGASNFPNREDTASSHDGVAVPLLLQNWQVVLRWKWLILGIVGVSIAVAVIATMLMKPQYSAVSRIEISRDQKNVTKVDGVEPSNNRQDLEFYQTQYSLLEARSLAERVARELRLAESDIFFDAHGASPPNSKMFGASGGRMSPSERDARFKSATDLLLKHILISPIRQSSLVDVSYVSGSPELSAKIANTWVAQFVQSSLDRRFDSTADARHFLENRLSDLRGRVERSERDAVVYAAQKGIVSLGRQISADGRSGDDRTLVGADLESLNTALTTATAERIAAESRARTAGPAGATSEALGNTAIATLRQRRAEAASEYAKVLTQFEPGYPAAKALRNQIATLDASIASEERRVSSSRSNEYTQAVKREQELSNTVNRLKSQLANQRFNSIQYNIFQREADTNRQLYDGLLQRYKEIGVAGVGANNISIVDQAQTPRRPSSPNLYLNLFLGLLGGVVIAGVVVFALDHIDEGVRTPAQVTEQLQVPLLGSVPAAVDGEASEMLRDVKSDIAEAYLSIRSNLAFATSHGVPTTLMVTSTEAGEGKSTTAFAIASVIGRTGKRVVLIDADMRSPSAHKLMGVSNDHGLSNILAGSDEWRASLLPTTFSNLRFMPAGPTPPSAAELLSSDRFSQLIQQLLTEADHVVVDAPPLLGLADAPLISRSVEGAIFVAEADRAPIRGIKGAMDRLRAAHAHIFGVVLTKLNARTAEYAYGFGYGQRYGSAGQSE